MEHNTTLDTAVKALGAKEIAPGRYGYLAEDLWYSVSSEALTAAALEAERSGQPDPSACVGGKAVALRAWWSPEGPFAIDSLSHDGEGFPCEPREVSRECFFASADEAAEFLTEDVDAAIAFECRIITCDLETGAETYA